MSSRDDHSIIAASERVALRAERARRGLPLVLGGKFVMRESDAQEIFENRLILGYDCALELLRRASAVGELCVAFDYMLEQGIEPVELMVWDVDRVGESRIALYWSPNGSRDPYFFVRDVMGAQKAIAAQQRHLKGGAE